jgi:hypothetical protein
MTFREKLYVKFNIYIYIGYLDDKNIYFPEIIICCTNVNESESTFNELKIKFVEDIINLTKRVDPNINSIGKYNNTNNLVIILNGKYSLKEITLPKKELISQNYGNQSQNQNNFSSNTNNKLTTNNNSSNEQYKSNQNKNYSDTSPNNVQLQKKIEEVKPKISQNVPDVKKKNGNNEIKKSPVKDSKELESLLNIMIDMRKINQKIKLSLNKTSTQEIYYPISCGWLKKYLEYTNLKDIYNNKYIYNAIDNIVSDPNKHITNAEILLYLKNQPDIINMINEIQINSPINN